MPSSKFGPFLGFVCLCLVLTGCGGGGDGGNNDPPPPAGPLTGAANATAKSVIQTVDIEDPYTADEISVSAAGEEIIRTKLKIVFRPEATVAQANALLTDLEAVITTSIAGLETVVIRIPDPGTLEALDGIVTRIENEPFVWFVSRAILPATSALPANIEPEEAGPSVRIRHHMAVGAPGAWNAREALVDIPRVIVLDFFGDGPPNGDLDYFYGYDDYVGDPDVDFGVGNLVSHGYHVAGIIAGRFGGADSDRGSVTGMLPLQMQLLVIDFKKTDPLSAELRLLIRLQAQQGDSKLIVNSSVGYKCNVAMTCVDEAVVRREAAWWAYAVRYYALEDRFLHVTAAGNIEDTADARDARYSYLFSAAALLDDLVDANGVPVPPLTNTLVIENVRPLPDFPYTGARCLSSRSFVNGHLGGVGTGPVEGDGVWSFTNAGPPESPGTADYKSGTSMAAPQVAGLAAYLLAIRPGLTPQQIKALLLETSIPVPVEVDAACSDWPTPAPLIQAYPALLALDQPNQGPAQAPVRRAILDINNSRTFTGDDILLFLTAFETAQGTLDFGRADLNNDGRTGGETSAPFDLNLDRFRAASGATAEILGETFAFNETALTDIAILCYYAYSSLYVGSPEARDQLLAPYRDGGHCGEPVNFSVSATFPEFVRPAVPELLEVRVLDDEGQPAGGLYVEIDVTGGTVSNASGGTGADGRFQTNATLSPGSGLITLNVTVRDAPGGTVIGTVTREASVLIVDEVEITILTRSVRMDGSCDGRNSSDGFNTFVNELQMVPVNLSESCSADGGTSSASIETDLSPGQQGGVIYAVNATASGSKNIETGNGIGSANTILEFRLSGAAPFRFAGTATGITAEARLSAGTDQFAPAEFGCVYSPLDTAGYANPCEERLPAGGADESGLLPAGVYRLEVLVRVADGAGSATVELRLGAAALE